MHPTDEWRARNVHPDANPRPEDPATWACGTRWNRAGSAAPGSTRIKAAGRRPSVALPSGPSSVSEFERLGPREHLDVRPGPETARFEVREESRILFGSLGDAVDRDEVAGRGFGQANAGRAPPGGFDLDGVAVRACLRVAQELVEASLDAG